MKDWITVEDKDQGSCIRHCPHRLHVLDDAIIVNVMGVDLIVSMVHGAGILPIAYCLTKVIAYCLLPITYCLLPIVDL
jgi:hypothetical protein